MSGFRQNLRGCMDFIKVLIHDVCIIVCIVCEPTAVQDKLLDYRNSLIFSSKDSVLAPFIKIPWLRDFSFLFH